jgi:hypothetical protein
VRIFSASHVFTGEQQILSWRKTVMSKKSIIIVSIFVAIVVIAIVISIRINGTSNRVVPDTVQQSGVAVSYLAPMRRVQSDPLDVQTVNAVGNVGFVPVEQAPDVTVMDPTTAALVGNAGFVQAVSVSATTLVANVMTVGFMPDMHVFSPVVS